MKIPIERWDNDLAFRLPEELVARFGLKDGDQFEAKELEAHLEEIARRRGNGR